MLRAPIVMALLLVPGPAAAVLVGTTALGPLSGTATGGGFFPVPASMAEADRQVWRTSFSLSRVRDVRLLVFWNDVFSWRCVEDTPCDDFETEQFGHAVTDGVLSTGVVVDGANRDPVTDFDEVLNDAAFFRSFTETRYAYETVLRGLAAGEHVIDLSGFGAPGGEAFPGSGGGVYRLNLTSLAVPEPATWTLLIVGFGLTGAALRRVSRASA